MLALCGLCLCGPAQGRPARKFARAGKTAPRPADKPADRPADRPVDDTDPLVALPGDGVAVLEYRTAVEHMGDMQDRLALALQHNTSLRVISPREGRQRLGARLD